jgi:type IV pilus assembly protein PilV
MLNGLRRNQGGFSLIEGLFAILIFSFGILALVAFQANSIKEISNSKYRIDASMLASQLVGQMWAGDRTTSVLTADYKTPDYAGGEGLSDGGAKYQQWATEVANTLPQADTNRPTITFAAATPGLATITIFWKAPGLPASAPTNKYTSVARITPP